MSQAGSQAKSRAVERLQRVILPRRGEPHDVRSLYMVESKANKSRAVLHSRTEATFPAGAEVSFETYFNGFPASYWRRWTQLKSVVLKLELQGDARADVYRSKIDGSRIAVEGKMTDVLADDIHATTAEESTQDTIEGEPSSAESTVLTLEFEIPLDRFEDGGWIWFDLICETDVTLLAAGWYAPEQPGPQTLPDGSTIGPQDKSVTVGIPTFNRPADAVAALEAIASDPEVDAVIDAVLMPDQGTKHPADEPGFDDAVKHFGDRFHEFRQGNLGGSGGYSRIMYEALGGVGSDEERKQRATKAPCILYMDDDIAIEPDSILRALQVARYARQPMLVGGQMLNLQERSHLHSMGEVIDRHSFMWTSAPHVHYDHDFYQYPLRDRKDHGRNANGDVITSRDLHRRIDVDYNGWWMCMIPRVVAETIGQPLPLFIKWDDGEYGLRAGHAGFPTASWPGIAIWHMAWSDKDDAIDWQAYFHLRNRLIVAAIEQDGSILGMLQSMAKATTKHLMCLEYSTVAIQNEAIKDFLHGPDQLFDILDTALPRINELRKEYPDAVVLPSASAVPPAKGGPKNLTKIPLNPLAKVSALSKAVKKQFSPSDGDPEVPDVNLPPIEARWFSMSRVDGATVTTADGRGVVFRKRNRAKAVKLARESMRLQKEIYDRFPEIRQLYRKAHPTLTSREGWSTIFER